MTTLDAAPETTPDHRGDRGRTPWWWGALAGLLAVGVALAIGELVTGLIEGTKTAVVSVGEVVVENAPNWLKEFAIDKFGENDKDALIAGTTVTLVVISVVLGILSVRRIWIGIAGTAVLGLVGAWAALTRPLGGFEDIWPSVLGTAGGIAVLWFLLGRPRSAEAPAAATGLAAGTQLRAADRPTAESDATGSDATGSDLTGSDLTGPTASAGEPGDRESSRSGPDVVDLGAATPERPATMRPTTDRALLPARPAPAPSGFDRRKFLISAGLIAGGAVVVGGAGRRLQGRFSVDSARTAVVLPPPADPAAGLPGGVDLGVDGIAPFVTPNGDFYRVDTSLVPPQISPADWSLTIKGMVDDPFEISFEEVLDMELVERDITLVCVSNEIGGPYTGNARWLGVPLTALLERAGVQAGADQMVSRSVDGWTAGSPTETVMDGRDALLAIGMNGEPLPIEHGFPARLVVPGLYGFTSATKWVTEIELTTFDAYDPYWVQRGWAQVAPIKTMARIDTPGGLANLKTGTVPIGGVAWAIHRGIEAVEVKIDDGPWQPAQLGAVPNDDTWRQWMLPWEATSGRHQITARAIDGTGEVQTDQRADPIPDGASGWHNVVVLVS